MKKKTFASTNIHAIAIIVVIAIRIIMFVKAASQVIILIRRCLFVKDVHKNVIYVKVLEIVPYVPYKHF